MKNITILGVTGSIGQQTVDVCLHHQDEFNVVAMSAGKNIVLLETTIQKINPQVVCVIDEKDCNYLQEKYPHIRFVFGSGGLDEIATIDQVDIVLNAIVGFAGLLPTIHAIESKKDIALANKETLVVAGHIITKLVKEHGVKLLPVDSEHSAIFQSLQGNEKNKINVELHNKISQMQPDDKFENSPIYHQMVKEIEKLKAIIRLNEINTKSKDDTIKRDRDTIQKLLKEIEELKSSNVVNKLKNERGAGRKEMFNEEQKARVKMLRLQGKSYRAIAKDMNCSVATVHKIINEQ